MDTAIREFRIPDNGLSSLPTGAVKSVVDSLGQRIANGELLPGETIPMEMDLSDEYSVSRTVLREAIKVLSGKGMIRTARRYGSRVRPFEEWHLLDPDVIGWHGPNSPMTARIYRESTDLRRVVEPEAAAMAAERATEVQRQTILDAARAITPEPYGLKGMIAADFAFHATILEATGNIMLAQLNSLILALLQFSYPTGAMRAPDHVVSYQEHVLVAEAIAVGHAERARELMLVMLRRNSDIADRLNA